MERFLNNLLRYLIRFLIFLSFVRVALFFLKPSEPTNILELPPHPLNHLDGCDNLALSYGNPLDNKVNIFAETHVPFCHENIGKCINSLDGIKRKKYNPKKQREARVLLEGLESNRYSLDTRFSDNLNPCEGWDLKFSTANDKHLYLLMQVNDFFSKTIVTPLETNQFKNLNPIESVNFIKKICSDELARLHEQAEKSAFSHLDAQMYFKEKYPDLAKPGQNVLLTAGEAFNSYTLPFAGFLLEEILADIQAGFNANEVIQKLIQRHNNEMQKAVEYFQQADVITDRNRSLIKKLNQTVNDDNVIDVYAISGKDHVLKSSQRFPISADNPKYARLQEEFQRNLRRIVKGKNNYAMWECVPDAKKAAPATASTSVFSIFANVNIYDVLLGRDDQGNKIKNNVKLG